MRKAFIVCTVAIAVFAASGIVSPRAEVVTTTSPADTRRSYGDRAPRSCRRHRRGVNWLPLPRLKQQATRRSFALTPAPDSLAQACW